MYCGKCGNELHDTEKFCPKCGAPQSVQPIVVQPNQPVAEQRTNLMAIVGFVLAFFFFPVGLICSAIGYHTASKCGGDGKGLAVAVIVISFIPIILIIGVIVFIGLLSAGGY